jgi:hypothetical protein
MAVVVRFTGEPRAADPPGPVTVERDVAVARALMVVSYPEARAWLVSTGESTRFWLTFGGSVGAAKAALERELRDTYSGDWLLVVRAVVPGTPE